MIDTLAVAYAETGDFNSAVQYLSTILQAYTFLPQSFIRSEDQRLRCGLLRNRFYSNWWNYRHGNDSASGFSRH